MKYYSTQRPVAPGSFPRPEGNKILNIHNYDHKTYCKELGREAWGYVEYEQPLTDKEARSYELTAEMDYPELSMYGEDFRIDLCRDNPEPNAPTCEVIFEVNDERFYCFIDGCGSYLEALGLFFKNHPNITYNMIFEILEDV